MAGQTSLDTLPGSPYTILVTLRWGEVGSEQVRRYVRWDSNLTIGADTFISAPELDAEIPEQHGLPEDKAGKLTIAYTREPADRLASGYAHGLVSVKIEQVDPTNTSTTRRTLYYGELKTATRNPSGRKGLVRFAMGGLKARLSEIRVSLPVTPNCPFVFGGLITDPVKRARLHCRKNATAFVFSGTVASIGSPARNSVTLTLPAVASPPFELADRKFRMGVIAIEGLRLVVRKSHENFTFDLFKLPPPWIIGKSCVLLPGCDKSLQTCREIWDNEARFGGCGIATPARNPVYEDT